MGFLSKNLFFESCVFSRNMWVKNCIVFGHLLLPLIILVVALRLQRSSWAKTQSTGLKYIEILREELYKESWHHKVSRIRQISFIIQGCKSNFTLYIPSGLF